MKINNKKRSIQILTTIHIILIVLEIIALIHDLQVFGLAMFKYYTIDSNVLQMLVSAAIVFRILYRKEETISVRLSILHLVCAVSLTVTFLIALLVLAPQEGFAYYFIENVAPINHLIGPLLSAITFLFLEESEKLPGIAILIPMAATLLYGIIALILNALKILDGPYFFLRIYDEPLGTIVLWFAIITVLCTVLSGLYMWIKSRYCISSAADLHDNI